MDHMAAMEEQVVSERVKQKLQDVNAAAQKHLSPIQDYVNFTLQVWGLHMWENCRNFFWGFYSSVEFG